MSRRFTEAQRAAILSTGHTLMAAGAGSGKTTTLVGKMLHAMGAPVIDGRQVPEAERCELHELAAITFTTAAAADLRRALRAELRALARRTRDERWRRMAYDVDRARIGTIHGFCAQVLREFALRAGMDPGFAILDEGEASAVLEECARRALHDALGDGQSGAAALALAAGTAGAATLVVDAARRIDVARRCADAWCGEEGALADALREAVERQGGQWRMHDEQAAEVAAAVLRLAVTAREAMEERLDEGAALDFDALIARTDALLATHPEIVGALRRRLRWLFVDEFQDTDETQKRIAYRVCAVGDTDAAAAPSLCVVGDPKQSIYRFRKADVTVWNAVAADFRRNGWTCVDLDTSFRSRAPLVGFANAVFERLMSPADGAAHAEHARPERNEWEVAFSPLVPARDYAADDGLVEWLAAPAGLKADERRAAEAELVARRLRAMVDGAEQAVRTIELEEGVPADVTKAATWANVALLFRSRTPIPIYERALRRHGIPYFVSAGGGFYEREEVRDLMLLLRALADPRDDVAWAGLLRSPFVGLADESLFHLRVARPRDRLSATLDVKLPDGDEDGRLAAAAGWLATLARLRDRVSVAALLERALDCSGYEAQLLLREGGDVAAANVRKLVAMADGAPDASLAEFVEMATERAERASREPEAPLHTAGENVVTLTTVHGAKGLEWPVVFLCDLDRDPGGGPSDALFFDEHAGIGFRAKDPQTGENPGAWELLERRDRAQSEAEDRRVLYVAVTRAMDRLVLCAAQRNAAPAPVGAAAEDGEQAEAGTKKKQPTAAQWLLDGLAVAGDEIAYEFEGTRWRGRVVTDVTSLATEVETVGPPTFAELAAVARTDADLAATIARPAHPVPLFRRSATELMAFERDAEAHRLAYVLGLRGVEGGSGNGAEAAPEQRSGGAGSGDPLDGLDRRLVGDVLHGALEELAALDDLDDVLERALVDNLGEDRAASLGAARRARLRELAAAAWEHEAVARLRAGRHERELPFVWLQGGQVVHGAMDLVGEVDGGVEVLDFKSSRVRPGGEKEVSEKYARQRDLYAAALADIVGAPTAFSFFFPETNRDVREPLDARAVEEGRQRVLTVLAGIAAQTAPPA